MYMLFHITVIHSVVLNDYMCVKLRRVYGLERACKVQTNRIERLEWVYEASQTVWIKRNYIVKTEQI